MHTEQYNVTIYKYALINNPNNHTDASFSHVLCKLQFPDGMIFTSRNLYNNDDGYKFLYLTRP